MWVLDYSASDHMTGNKSILSHLSYLDSLPSITVNDGSKIKVQGLGQTHLLPNLSLDFVIYIPGFPFNLIYVNKLICTIDCSVLLLIIFLMSRIDLQDGRLEQGVSLEDYIIYHRQWHVLLSRLETLHINV